MLDQKTTQPVLRYQNAQLYNNYHFEKDGSVVAVNAALVNKKHNNDGPIKLLKEDFALLDRLGKRYTHFNIQYCGHLPERNYLIVRIDRPGYFDGKVEIPPVINRTDYFTVKCLSVRNYVSYTDLKEGDFRYSLENIKDVDSLKKMILRRYSNSLAHLTNDEKLGLGVSITELEIMERFSEDLLTAV